MVLRSREIRLKRRPVGAPVPDDFQQGEADVPAPGPGEVQVRNAWMSVDPYMRGRMSDRPSYVPPFELGKAMQGGAVGEVVASAADGFGPGDLEGHYRELAKRIPIGRVAHAAEFGDLVAFLVSDRASYITGTAINFDGGMAAVV